MSGSREHLPREDLFSDANSRNAEVDTSKQNKGSGQKQKNTLSVDALCRLSSQEVELSATATLAVSNIQAKFHRAVGARLGM